MFDFLLTHNHTENPTALGILITVMSSFFLASLVALTYQWTTPTVQKSNNLMQSMVLIAIVAAMVMQAIGDSLARGLGMLGALAIIRFRTKLDNPRNMAFIFAALANGIACGVYGFTIAYIGTAAFCLVAIIIKISGFGAKNKLIGTLRFQTLINSDVNQKIENILKKITVSYTMKSEKYINVNKTKAVKDEAGQVIGRTKLDIMKEYIYLIDLGQKNQSEELVDQLIDIDGISNVRLNFGETDLNL